MEFLQLIASSFLHRLCLALAALALSAGSSFAQVPDNVAEENLRFAARPTHGVNSISAADFDRVLSDTAFLHWLADLLTGEESSTFPWSPPVALWWLAQSGDDEYIPIFLDWAERDDTDLGDQFAMVAHGLAAHAKVPTIRARIRALALERPNNRRWIVESLALVGDTAAHNVLRDLRQDDLLGDRRAYADSVLRTEPGSIRPRRIGCRTGPGLAREERVNDEVRVCPGLSDEDR